MKAARIEDGELHIRDVEVPAPGDDEALVRITAAGVCHSDLHLVRGDWNGMPPAGRRPRGDRRGRARSGPAPSASRRSATG